MTTSAPPAVIVPATPSSREVLARLFPGVKPQPSLLAPGRIPNSGPEATAALLKALRDNHERSHVFFNEFSFHNAAYEGTHFDHMRVALPRRRPVRMNYFQQVVLEPGATISNVLEKYIFSLYYNVRTPQQGAEQPQMLNQLLEILIHQIIYVGYGAEFGIPGLIAEGLAWASVHPAGATTFITRLLFTPTRTTPITDLERQEPKWMPKPGLRLRALNILSLILRNPRFGSKVLDKYEYAAMLESHGEVINTYAEMWDCNIRDQQDLEEHVEELIWVATLVYGVGSWDGDQVEYRADFFTAHIVTSVLFISSICAHLSHPSQTKLLRAHFLTSITWWLVRGRPGFRLKEFTSQPLRPLPKGASFRHSNTFPRCQPTPSVCILPSPLSPYSINANPWYSILADAVVHPNEHLCTVQRALAHFGVLYGHREFVLESPSRDVNHTWGVCLCV